MFLLADHNSYCKEFPLNFSESLNCDVVFDKKEWNLGKDAVVSFRKQNGGVVVTCDSKSRFLKHNETKSFIRLPEENTFYLITADGKKIFLYFCADSAPLTASKKILLNPKFKIAVGSSSKNSICFKNEYFISDLHAVIFFSGSAWYVSPKGKYGVFVNSEKISGTTHLHFGDDISMFGLHLVYFGTVLAVGNSMGKLTVSSSFGLYNCRANALAKSGAAVKVKQYSCPARKIPYISEGETEIEAPQVVNEMPKKNMLSVIGRPLTMAIPMLLGCTFMALGTSMGGGFMSMGIITAVSSALLGAVWAMKSVKSDDYEEKEAKRFQAYASYITAVSNDLAKAYKANIEAMNYMYPSSRRCVDYDEKCAKLWSRNPSHEDFLFVRLGLGQKPFQIKIKVPKKSFKTDGDVLSELPYVVQEDYKTMHNVPIGIDLRANRLVGVIGVNGNTEAAANLVNCIITQIAANNCYSDVKTVLLDAGKNQLYTETFSYMLNLPHCWSSDKKTRYYSSSEADVEDVSYELLKLMRIRASAEKQTAQPHYVVIVTDPRLLEHNLAAGYLLEPQESYGITTIVLSKSLAALPNSCHIVLETNGKNGAVNDTLDSASQKSYFKQDTVDLSHLVALSRRLANITVEEKAFEQSIPQQVDFLEMFHADTVEELGVLERWQKNRIDSSIGVPVGAKAGGELCILDIHEKFHGPHGLVAGTTGSGKSETLQSYLLSLCVNFSPDDINLFIIDYKGGGMANLFEKLPHLAGSITNLSGNNVRRAMISIKSETVRRQMLFNEYGVNSINQYTKMFKDGGSDIPIPHLIIVIDEFAELKKAQPEFMQEIISVAQVGRSLGVHLILATQKPSGTVDDNIRSNAKFRLCLRVQDRQDSVDMLHRPDAAFITQPGGCILQVGNDEVFEPFQSAWTGGIYIGKKDSNSSSAKMITNTGKTVVSLNYNKIHFVEERKKEWVKTVVEFILAELSDKNINSLNEQEKLYYGGRVFDSIKIKYPDFKGSASAFAQYMNLWPAEYSSLSAGQIATVVSDRARKEGVTLIVGEEKTVLDAVALHLADVSAANNFSQSYKLWLAPLNEKITLEDIPEWKSFAFKGEYRNEPSNSVAALVGMVDNPSERAQNPIFVDFTNGGNQLIIGSVVSGKSTFLQTVLYGLVNRYSPREVNLYIIDYSSRMLSVFESAPHTGGYVSEGNESKLEKLFILIQNEIEYRKKVLAGGTFTEYIKSHYAEMPAWIIAIDNFAGFKEKTASAYEQTLIQLSREGNSYGIYLIITASGFGLNEVTFRMSENFRTSYALQLSDKYKYAEVMHENNLQVLPEENVRGRGLIKTDDAVLEFQTAVINGGDDDYSRAAAAKSLFEKIAETVGEDEWAKRIPEIPEKPTLSLLRRNERYKQLCEDRRMLPIGYNERTADVYALKNDSFFCCTVLYQRPSDKGDLLGMIIKSACDKKDSEVAVFCNNNTYDKYTAESSAPEIIKTDKEIFAYFKRFSDIIVQRNKVKREMIDAGCDDAEIFERMAQFNPVYLIIDDLSAFFNSVYHPSDDCGKMNGFVENILDRGASHNVYIFGALNNADLLKVKLYKGFELFSKEKFGILSGSSVSSQRILNFGNVPLAESTKIPSKNNVFVTDGINSGALTTVVIPAVNR